jgi:hypothetical protein
LAESFREELAQSATNVKDSFDPTFLTNFNEALVNTGQATTETTQAANQQAEAIRNVAAAAEESVAPIVQLTEEQVRLGQAANKAADSIIRQGMSEQEQLIEKQRLIQKALKDGTIAKEKAAKAEAVIKKKIDDINDKAEKKRTAFEKQQQKERLDAASTAFGNLATLSQSKNKELAAIGKAAAIAQTTIDTYRAAQSAYASLAGIPFVGPALGIAASAAAIVAGLARVAQIRGTPLQEGITSVPGIGTQDNFPATLAPRERVITAEQNQDLTEFLADNQGQNEILMDIRDRLENLESQIIVNVGGTEISDELLDLQRSGRSLRAA